MKQGLCLVATILLTFAALSDARAQVRCGDRIGPTSRPIALTQNLRCGGDSTDDSIILEGPVTLEMRGRTITCTGENNDGILLTGTRAKLIGPGRIIDCNNGVFLSGNGSHTVQRVTVGPSASRISDGIVVFSPSNIIRGNTVRDVSFDAIRIFSDSDFNRISFNKIRNVGGIGIRFIQLTNNDVARSNTLSRNRIARTEGSGIEVASDARIIRSTITRAGGNGITVLSGEPANKNSNVRLIKNTISSSAGHGIALQLDTTRNVVRGNRVTASRLNGIFVVRRSTRNNLSRNRVSQSIGFDVIDQNVNCDRNTWTGNVFGTKNRGRACIR